jgi:hypothetical protein
MIILQSLGDFLFSRKSALKAGSGRIAKAEVIRRLQSQTGKHPKRVWRAACCSDADSD